MIRATMLALAALLPPSAALADDPYGIKQRPQLAPLNFPDEAPQSGDVAVVRAFPKLHFDAPLFVTAAPGDARHLYVVTQPGVIYVIDNDAATTGARVFLDLSARVTDDGGELGLLGLAFDPDYARNGFLYVDYNPNHDGSAAIPLRTVIARFTARGERASADPASETQLLRFTQPYSNHNGGWLGFGPDRKLYIASGDGGSGGDPQGNGQNLNTLLGKMLRIDADGSIPADNPFAGQSGRRGEIWAYGLRNPFRDSFDRASGALWAGEVGQNAYEEIDLIRRGGNYGWNVREGFHGYPDAGTPKPAGSHFIDPIAEYGHATGCSITGGYVYRGSAIAALAGAYLYTDYCTAGLYALVRDAAGKVVSNSPIAQIPGNPTSFGEDASGELYTTSFDGNLYKIVPNSGGGQPFPQRLSQTGLFTDTAALKPNPGLIRYDVNAPFWSDAALKVRWIGMPNGAQIGFSADGAWDFPAGSVIVKQFSMRLADGSLKRLETRVLINQRAGWQGYTYRWNDAGTDADLLTDAATTTLTVADGRGGSRQQLYEFPGRGACLSCHATAAGFILGVRSPQLNGPMRYGTGVTDNQLRTLNHIGLFDRDIGNAAQYATLTPPTDTGASLTDRARAYLDVNCGQCHRPGGPTPVDMDLRADTAPFATHTIGVLPTEGSLGLRDARRIAPGNKFASVLWQRMRRLDDDRMPPIASHRVDRGGVNLIGDWIEAGPE